MKIALVSTWYPMSISRYFERALKRRSDIELITVGPYTGQFIPWNGGMNLPAKYAIPPTHPLPSQFIMSGKIHPNLLKNYADLNDVDLWIEVDAGFYLDPRPAHGMVAHVASDPHALTYDRQRQLADKFFCMQTPYMKDEDFYLPYAFDPTIHFPEDHTEKIYDACLVGLAYDHRVRLITVLSAMGLKIRHGIGDIFDEYRLAYNQSKIALSWSSLQDLPARVFEALGMGLPLVANRVPDMPTFFVDGEHYLGFSDITEAIFQVNRLMRDEDLRHQIADAGHRKVQPHTWDKRITQILSVCGFNGLGD